MQRVQLFTRAAALAAACTVASAGLSAQTPQTRPAQPAPQTQPRPQSDAAKKTAPTATPASSEDNDFAMKAAAAGMAEVEQGKMAAQKAANAQVKAYANRLVRDHTTANTQLKAIAKRHDIELPASAPAASDPWMSQSGAAFDKGFIDAQVKAHEDAVTLFENESKNGSDKELKAFAAKQLPGLRAHLKQAQDLQKKLGTTTH